MKKALFIWGLGIDDIKEDITSQSPALLPRSNDWYWLNMCQYFNELDIQFDYLSLDKARGKEDTIASYDYIIFYVTERIVKTPREAVISTLAKDLEYYYDIEDIYIKAKKNNNKVIMLYGEHGGMTTHVLYRQQLNNVLYTWPYYTVEYMNNFCDGVISPYTSPHIVALDKIYFNKPVCSMPPAMSRSFLNGCKSLYKERYDQYEEFKKPDDIRERWVVRQRRPHEDAFLDSMFLLEGEKKLAIASRDFALDEVFKNKDLSIEVTTTHPHWIWGHILAESKGVVYLSPDHAWPISRQTIACLMGNKPCIAIGAFQYYFYPKLTYKYTLSNVHEIQRLIKKNDFQRHIDLASRKLDDMITSGAQKLRTFLKEI